MRPGMLPLLPRRHMSRLPGRGCDIHAWCKSCNCCRRQGLNGGGERDRFPCRGGMPDKPRMRALARFAGEYGSDRLTDYLRRNEAGHIIYHYEGQLVGDYDNAESEEEVLQMILQGRPTRSSAAIYGENK